MRVRPFDGIHTADEVLNKVHPMQKEHLIDLEDACVVGHARGQQGHIKQAVNLMALGAATGGVRGMLLGTLLGILFLNPLAGMAMGAVAGAGAGALSSRLVDFGINDDFIRKLGETVPVEILGPVRAGQERDRRQGAARDRALQAGAC